MSTATVHIIDVDAHQRHSMSCLLRSSHYRVQCYADAAQFLHQRPSLGPGCLVLELDMPEMTGLDLQEILSREDDYLSVIFVSSQADIESSVRAMKAGAIDFFTKPIDNRQLLLAVEAGLELSARAVTKRIEIERDQTAFVSLSPREQYVCLRIAQGLLNKQVGFELGTSEKTIKAQRSKMMQKLGAGSLPDVVRLVDRLRTAGGIPAFSAHPPKRRGSEIPRSLSHTSCCPGPLSLDAE
jgi:FixJ family two-component response regulator